MDVSLKIGVVGFSSPHFDQEAAKQQLEEHLQHVFSVWGVTPEQTELVSGLTNMGVPKLAYQIADTLGMITIGFSAKQALRVKSGTYPVARRIVVGEKFGDESEEFVAYVDVMVRVGGGPQSRHEVELFRARFPEAEEQEKRLFESEVTWFGSPKTPKKKSWFS
ncbi:MAG: hypothetical protein H6728_10405 [Myxococcales bacterium]|nr:hypothetical protein [Myxococcales bacterium]MCB9643469.1 hypothetical protein [Myxococcales bacterium]